MPARCQAWGRGTGGGGREGWEKGEGGRGWVGRDGGAGWVERGMVVFVRVICGGRVVAVAALAAAVGERVAEAAIGEVAVAVGMVEPMMEATPGNVKQRSFN